MRSYLPLIVICILATVVGVIFELGGRGETRSLQQIIVREKGGFAAQKGGDAAQKGMMHVLEPADSLWQIRHVTRQVAGETTEELNFQQIYRPFQLDRLGIENDQRLDIWIESIVDLVNSRGANVSLELVPALPQPDKMLIVIAVTLQQIRAFNGLPSELSGIESKGGWYDHESPSAPAPAPEAAASFPVGYYTDAATSFE